MKKSFTLTSLMMVAAMQSVGIYEANAGVQDLIRYTDGTQRIDVANLVDQVKPFFQSINRDNCRSELSSFNDRMENIRSHEVDRESIKANYASYIKKMFLARLELREKLKQMSAQSRVKKACENEIRRSMRVFRYTEEHFAKVADLKFNQDVFQGEEPFMLLNPKYKEFKLKSGDVLISRGNAIVSAAIARVGKVDGQFSHAAIIYVDEATQIPYAVEAHIEIGTDVAAFAEKYAQDGKTRSVLFRHPNEELAKKAGQIAYQTATEAMQKGARVPYDFSMTLDNESELFCSEIPYMAFKKASAGSYIMGSQYRTEFDNAHNAFLKGIGITNKSTLSPTDIEFDTQLELVAEWRDLEETHKTHRKDAVLTSFFNWFEKENMSLRTDYSIGEATIAYAARRLPFISELLKDSVAPNVTITTMANMSTMDKAGSGLMDILNKYYEDRLNDSNMDMTFIELLEAIRDFRSKDEIVLKKYQKWVNSTRNSGSQNQSYVPPEESSFMKYFKR